METPTSIQFTDFEISTDVLFRRAHSGPMNPSWTRVQFPISNNWDDHIEVEKWLGENTPGKWASYHYQNPKGKKHDFTMIVRFENKNDALMFKLRGGHQAWENR
jgi:hypothetical protein